ncbi:hypothetical protein ACTA71_001459 [Dictyostelium dimigraforme]
MAEITISIENEDFIQINLQPDQKVEELKRTIEFQTTILIKDQVLTLDGKVLENGKKLSDYSIKGGDFLLMTKNILRPPQQRAPQQQNQQRQQQQQQKDPLNSPQDILDHFTNNPEDLTQVINSNPALANAILSKDMKFLTHFVEQIKEQRRVQELALKDPYGEEYQKLAYQYIQQQNIERNMQHAMEHTPEVFASVYMLYIECSINGHPLKAFVDTGAQQSIMSEKCAERCEISRIIDTRFHGIAKGVGTSKIIGRVHSTDLKLGNSLFSVSLSILQNQDVDFILGLDMLKRHQVILDLNRGILQIANEKIEFLHEKDLKEILNKEQNDLEEDTKKATANSLSPSTNSTTTTTTTTASPQTPTTITTSPVNNNNNNNENNNNNDNTKPPVNSPPVAKSVTPTPQPTTNQYASEANIQTLMGLGCSREKAIRLLTQAKGNVDVAASMFFG